MNDGRVLGPAGLHLGSMQPMVMSLLHQLAPEHRYGEAVAMRVIVNNASSVSVPLLSGLAGSLIGAAARLARGLEASEGVRQFDCQTSASACD